MWHRNPSHHNPQHPPPPRRTLCPSRIAVCCSVLQCVAVFQSPPPCTLVSPIEPMLIYIHHNHKSTAPSLSDALHHNHHPTAPPLEGRRSASRVAARAAALQSPITSLQRHSSQANSPFRAHTRSPPERLPSYPWPPSSPPSPPCPLHLHPSSS